MQAWINKQTLNWCDDDDDDTHKYTAKRLCDYSDKKNLTHLRISKKKKKIFAFRATRG